MQFHLHQTHHTLADFPAILKTLQEPKAPGVHLYPELFLTGYPLADLCLQVPFIRAHQEHLKTLDAWAKAQPAAEWVALAGGLAYELGPTGLPLRIRNVVYEIRPGLGLKDIYTKRLLPNYDIFDEQKYFTPGETPGVWQWGGKTFALLICEDMWASSFHKLDPCQDLAAVIPHGGYSAAINLSASPFTAYKQPKRLARATELSHLLKTPFLYVNRVGGEDEILFDGQSFALNGDLDPQVAPSFASHTLSLTLPPPTSYREAITSTPENTWESLFAPHFSPDKAKPLRLERWDDDTCALVARALQFGLQEYATKNGFKRFVVALSGGMDSGLVLALARLSLKPGQELEAVYMPSIHSATLSWELSSELCRRLGVRLTSFPIKFLHSNVKLAFQSNFSEPFEGLTDENVQSRLRGMLLYTRSNQTGSMVINTSNKSELAVGYSTQYGDSVGALSLLGDLYKTEVYRLAEWLNATYDSPIPDGILTRAPSAELREGQTDQQSLPPYERLDAMLEAVLSYHGDAEGLRAMGFEDPEIQRVFQLYANAEYKRRQFGPILKVKPKSFGFGHRNPISKATGFYFPRA